MDYSQIKNIIFESDKGKIRVRYRTLDNKLHRLPPSEHPRFDSMEEANEWRKKKEAYLQSEKSRIKKIQNQNAKFPEVTDKVELFITYKINHKVKDFKTINSYFQNYILNFYLNKLSITNLNSWSLNHDHFLNYLKDGTQTKFGRPLSNETIRKIGFYLNEFYLFLYQKHLIDQPIPPLTVPEPEDNLKSLEDAYWPQAELDRVLSLASTDLSDFITVLRHSGFRLNEALGLSILNFIDGQNDILNHKLKLNGIETLGFIQLEGQLDLISGSTFSLKPFKSCKSINPRHFRYIPVIPELYRCVSNRIQRLNIPSNLRPNDSRNLLFNFNSNHLLAELYEICDTLGIKRRGFHSFRHTFATDMLIKTQCDANFVGILTGHKCQKVFQRYSHLTELLNFKNNVKNKRMF